MINGRQLISFDDVQKQAKALAPAIRKHTLDLLQDVKEFVDTNKIQCEYRLAIDDKDYEHSGIILGKIVMPKTLLNFLLSKYVAQVKPNAGSKRPSPYILLGMLLKHQTFNVQFVGNALKCMYKTGTFKSQPKKEGKENKQ